MLIKIPLSHEARRRGNSSTHPIQLINTNNILCVYYEPGFSNTEIRLS